MSVMQLHPPDAVFERGLLFTDTGQKRLIHPNVVGGHPEELSKILTQ